MSLNADYLSDPHEKLKIEMEKVQIMECIAYSLDEYKKHLRHNKAKKNEFSFEGKNIS